MQTLQSVKIQLAQLGYRGRVLGRGEVLELFKVLRTNEHLVAAVFGFCNGASVLLAATNHRLLMINKRFYHCKCDDVPYQMIGQVENISSILTSRIKIDYRGGQIVLKGVPKTRAELFVNTLEKRVEGERKLDRGPED